MPNVRVCIKDGPGKVSLVDMALPDPGPGQALIRTTLTSICGSDIHLIDEFPDIPAGVPMGHEAIGVVEAVGEGVERIRVGDRVVASCLTSCGSCEPCTSGEPQVCSTHGAPMNLLFGAQAEAFLLNGADFSCTTIPSGMADRDALFASDILSTGFGAIERADFREGQTVAIFAQGPVGLCATIAAKTYGASAIFAVESVPERVAMARRLGADQVLDPETAVEQIMALTGGRGVDVAVEALGRQQTLTNCFRVVRFGGTVSSVGVYGASQELAIPCDGSFYHRRFVTTLCPSGRARLDHLLGLIEQGRVDATPLLTHAMPLSQVVRAYEMFRTREDGVLKIALS
ncbi:MAG: alcohol dehydrogenase catalytic domain-containing protein [Deltaproteobacteria bacterium]|nr:alcohol dehydrogenase catalytic domain-containing protein [Deltaproteobacteria bacterium]